MNRMNAKDYLPIVQALADGKIIQFKYGENSPWRDTNEITEITFQLPANYYRIKPVPKEIWVNEYPDGRTGCHPNEHRARMNGGSDAVRLAVRYREVMDE